MDITELHRKLASLRLTRDSSVGDADDHQLLIEGSDVRYTSLRDLILTSPPSHSAALEGNEFDSSKITIRNQLVKSAASAYLQSAAILVSRNDNCFVNFWGKIKNEASSCKNYFRDLLQACFGPIYHFLSYTLAGVWDYEDSEFQIIRNYC